MNLNDSIDALLRDPGIKNRLEIRIPHLLVGNRTYAQFVVREVASRRLADDKPNHELERQRIKRGVHPSYLTYFLNPGAKIADAREIAVQLEKRDQSSDLHLLISGFDFLNHKSQDVLLKQLEDGRVHSFLLVQNIDSVVRTIRSRCDVIYVPGIDVEPSLELMAICGFAKQELSKSAFKLARGDVDRALFWLRDETSHDIIMNWIDGPSKIIQFLLKSENDLDPGAMDAAYVALKWYLSRSPKKNAIDILRTFPPRYQNSAMLRHFVTDHLLLCVSGFYGEIKLNG